MTLDLYSTVRSFYLCNSATKHACVPGFWTRPFIKHCGSNTWTKCELLFSTLSLYLFIAWLIFKMMFSARCIFSLCLSGLTWNAGWIGWKKHPLLELICSFPFVTVLGPNIFLRPVFIFFLSWILWEGKLEISVGPCL